MKKIIAWAGSNSKHSINRQLVLYVAHKIENVTVIPINLHELELPLYGIDLQKEHGFPANVIELNDTLSSADGLVLSLAEHNGSYTAAFKNAFDWLSRIDKNVWKGIPTLLMATSPGGRGGAKVLQTAKEMMPFFGGNVIADFSLPSFHANFTPEGITDEALSADLTQKIQLFQQAIYEREGME